MSSRADESPVAVHLIVSLALVVTLGGCSDTPEQGEGKCKMEAASKIAPTGGQNSHLAAALLVGEYVNGCMATKGYKRNDKGEWAKR